MVAVRVGVVPTLAAKTKRGEDGAPGLIACCSGVTRL